MNLFRFFGELKDLVTEKSKDSKACAASTAVVDSGNAQRTVAQKACAADKTSFKLEDSSRKRTVVEEGNDNNMKPLDDELDI
ncbi:MAG: hypothetical protein MJE68_29475, partial [Proteobacteria bacterium]|nr:hypothetical protein [Pseudomonadota bacterium]